MYKDHITIGDYEIGNGSNLEMYVYPKRWGRRGRGREEDGG